MNARGWLALALLLAVVAFLALALPRLERTPPNIEAPSEVILGRSAQRIRVELSDLGSGLRSCDVRLVVGGRERTLSAHEYPGHWLTGGVAGGDRESLELRLDVVDLSLPDGRALLAIAARDWSWWDGFLGNAAEAKIELRIDTTPPEISLETGITYVHRGGSGVAVYRVDEPIGPNGVRVGEVFFRGYPLSGDGEPGSRRADNRYAALFAIPVEAPLNPGVHVVAQDAAGNETAVRYRARILERGFPERSITLTRSLLEQTLGDLAPARGRREAELVEAFQQVNGELRRRNEEQIRGLASDSRPHRLWSGAFQQMHGTAVTSEFAERRRYLVGDQEVAEATHYGFDLASTSRAEVTAAATGVVRYAGRLGIYGKLVLLDHGMGLTSLYGHLSHIDVEEGDRVGKGSPLGRSGATGLAGGDHLHFAILVGETYVNPLEWWDPKWVRSHVEVRLEAAGS